MIIHLNNLNEQQITRYDLLLRKLADQILEKCTHSDIPKYFSSIDYGGQAERLLECAKQSQLLYPRHTGILENFQNILSETTPYVDPDTLDIMVPILFFCAILKNEYNHNTVSKRIQRGAINWGKNEDLLNDVLPTPSKNKAHKDRFEKICLSLQMKYALRFGAPDDNPLFYTSPLHIHAKQALLLTGYYDAILVIQEIAKIGRFAFSILKSEHDSKTPMKTLIRMYVIEKICNLLSSCENLSEYFPLYKTAFGGPVSHYYFNGDPALERRLSNQEFAFWREVKHIDQIDVSKVIQILETDEDYAKSKNVTYIMQYEALFHWMPLSNEEISEMLSYFFDEQKLTWYSNFYSHVMDYLSCILKALDGEADFDETKFESMDKYTSFLNSVQ